MTEKRLTLEELATALEAKGLKGVSGTLPPITPKTRRALEEFSRQHQEFLRKGEEYLKTPQWNSDGCCPKCGSKQYFDLYGGRCNKSCAKCNTAYDCISTEQYLEQLNRPVFP